MNIDNTKLDFIILAQHEGEVNLVAMDKEKLDAISFVLRQSIEVIVPTGKRRAELLEFLNYKENDK